MTCAPSSTVQAGFFITLGFPTRIKMTYKLTLAGYHYAEKDIPPSAQIRLVTVRSKRRGKLGAD
jgi:hypothetical protein